MTSDKVGTTADGGSEPAPARRLLAGHRIKIRIAAVSALVLAVGAWLAPREAPAPLSTSEERPAPLLEEQVQAREVVRPFRGVQDVSSRVRDQIVAILSAGPRAVTLSDFAAPPADAPVAGYGVFAADGYVVTHDLALGGHPSVQVSASDGNLLDAEVAAYEPSSGLVLLRTNASENARVAYAAQLPAAGSLAAAVGRWNARDIVVPVFITNGDPDRFGIGTTNGSVAPGMPVYNLDGELVAIAGDARSGRAYPIRDAADRLIARASTGERPGSFGIAVQPITGNLVHTFGEKGALISDVVAGGPADMAGVQPGDVLLAVGDVDIDSPDTAVQAIGAIRAGTNTTLRVIRRGRIRTFAATPLLAFEVTALVRSEGAPPGPEARMLIPAPLLERTGIPATARVLSVNGRVVASRTQMQRELRRARQPVVLLLFHDGRRFFAAIEPAT